MPESKNWDDENERLLLLKRLANAITCHPFRDALENLHADGKISEEEIGPLMKEVKNDVLLTLCGLLGAVFKISVPENLVKHCERRCALEWKDHGEVPGEWDEFDRSLKKAFELNRPSDGKGF